MSTYLPKDISHRHCHSWLIIIQEILRKCEDLEERLHNKTDDFENELAGRRMWQAQARRSQSDLQEATLASVSRSSIFPSRIYPTKEKAEPRNLDIRKGSWA